MSHFPKLIALLAVSLLLPTFASAQDTPPDYGAPIKLAVAKKIVAAAEAEAAKHKWQVVITILDSGANMVMLHRMDNAQLGSVDISINKAKSAVKFRRPTKVFQDAMAESPANAVLLSADGLILFDGGHPIIQNGKIIGAIGVSGVTSEQDSVVAVAALKALSASNKGNNKKANAKKSPTRSAN